MVTFPCLTMNDFRNADEAVAAFDWSGASSPATALVEAICDSTGALPTELPPLYESVDPEALDATLTGLADNSVAGRVQFTYGDYRVTMTSDCEAAIHERDPPAEA